MADVFSKEKRSEIMSLIRGRNTKPELEVFRYLRREKIHFQKHYKRAPGSPDVALPRRKLAVFIDGDFWHGRHFAKRGAKLPKEYWQAKIAGNMTRDRKHRTALRRGGWKVLRIWEGDLKGKKKQRSLEKIKEFLSILDH